MTAIELRYRSAIEKRQAMQVGQGIGNLVIVPVDLTYPVHPPAPKIAASAKPDVQAEEEPRPYSSARDWASRGYDLLAPSPYWEDNRVEEGTST